LRFFVTALAFLFVLDFLTLAADFLRAFLAIGDPRVLRNCGAEHRSRRCAAPVPIAAGSWGAIAANYGRWINKPRGGLA
jgi:hypothetical protein